MMNASTCRFFAAIAISSAVSTATPVQAVSLDIGGLRFGEISGNFNLVNGRVDPDGFYTVEQEVYGPDTNLYMSIDGFPRLCRRCSFAGIGFQSVLINLTGTPWIFVDHELQEEYGTPSPEADGLSFGQFLSQFRPFTSNRFSTVEEEIDVRDYVNFSGGIVAPGESVVFRYIFTDTSPLDRFFLLQRLNFQPRVGFIDLTPPPPSPPPIEVVVTNPPLIQPPLQPPIVVEPTNPGGEVSVGNSSAAVPEPTTILGSLIVGAIAIHRRFQRKD